MYKKAISLIVIMVVGNLVCYSGIPKAGRVQDDSASDIKAAVNKIGENYRVKIKLRDGKKLKGFIKEIKPDSFVLVDGFEVVNGVFKAVDKTNSAREIQFSDVVQIKKIKNIAAAVVGAPILAVGLGAVGLGVIWLLARAGN